MRWAPSVVYPGLGQGQRLAVVTQFPDRAAVLDAVFLTPAEGRIGKDDVYTIRLRVADIGPRQSVVMAHETGILNAMQKHVGDAKHVR